MKKKFFMIITIILVIGIIAFLFLYKKDKTNNENYTIVEQKREWIITFYENDWIVEDITIDWNIFIIRTKNNFEMIFEEMGRNVKEFNWYRYIINAWYFDYKTNEVNKNNNSNRINNLSNRQDYPQRQMFIPSWLFIKNWEKLSDIKLEDKNITAFVNIKENGFEFISNKNINNIISSIKNWFQAWPFIIKKNKLQYEEVTKSTHWMWNHYRTILWYDNFWYNYYIITSWKYTLEKIWNIIINNEQTKNRIITLLNLDWWASTSLFDYKRQAGFNTDKILPLFLWIK